MFTNDTRSVLVIDDERGLCDVVKVILESQGYTVHQAHDPHAALGMLDHAQPDLILTDLMMPGMDGNSLIVQLQDTPHWSQVPVVMITAHAEPEVMDSALAAGASGFMAKPFTANELRATVGSYFAEN